MLHATPLCARRLSPSAAGSLAALATAATALLFLPGVVGAQAELSIGPYLSYERLVLNQPAAIGLDVTGFGGPIGLRGSASILRNSFSDLGYDDDPYGSGTDRPLQWNADADLLLRLTTSSSSGSPFVYGFLGLGVMQRAVDQIAQVSSVNTTANWSYGGGVTLPLGPLALTGEARLRRPYSSSSGFGFDDMPSREYRLGVSLHFGGGRRDYGARSTPRRTPSRTGRIIGAVTTARDAATVAGGAGAARAAVIPTAEHYLGVKYRYGGTSPTSGFDCSGFVQYVFAKHGVKLPRTSRQQAQAGTRLATRWSALTPGDLAMFAEDGEQISHVAIYAGDNRIIHATSSGGEVRYDDLDTPRGRWFEEHLVAARRVTPDARGLMLDLARGFAKNVQLDRGDLAPRP